MDQRQLSILWRFYENSYNEESDEGRFLFSWKWCKISWEILRKPHSDLLYLPEGIKIGKYGKLVTNLQDKLNMSFI